MQLLLLGLFHQFNTLLGYFSTPDLARMFHALTISSIIALVVWGVWGEGAAPPRGVIGLDFVFCLVGLTGARLALRTFRESLTASSKRNGQRKRRVGIIGAGDAGAVLAHELSLKPGYGLEPVAFFDDDQRKWHSRVHDIPVLGPPEKLLEVAAKLDIQEAIIAMPSAPAKRIGEIVRLLRQARVQCKTIPSLDQLALGQVRVSQLRNVEVQDLLGRERGGTGNGEHPTGLAGSRGPGHRRRRQHRQRALPADRHLSSQAACSCWIGRNRNVFQIEQELIGLGHGAADRASGRRHSGPAPAWRRFSAAFRPQVVFHAAAHKHVPMMEHQPGEAVKNNSLGTAQLADLALEFGVERFILISTDKAINPTSVMGATKRLAEIYVQALVRGASRPNEIHGRALRQRPRLLRQRHPPVPAANCRGRPGQSDPSGDDPLFHDHSRSLHAGAPKRRAGHRRRDLRSGHGQTRKIVDLARQMIELSGLKPDEDIQIEFIGIRPGEKLFEEITHKGENFAPTTHPKICRFLSQPADLAQMRETLQRLRASLHQLEPDQLKRLLQEASRNTPLISCPAPMSCP